jgi:hypothetical protein
VTHFNWIFTQDPQNLARCALSVAAILAFVPNVIIMLGNLSEQHMSSNLLTRFLIGYTEVNFEINFLVIYFMVWLLISLVLTAIIVFGIPVYLRKIHSISAIRNRE